MELDSLVIANQHVQKILDKTNNDDSLKQLSIDEIKVFMQNGEELVKTGECTQEELNVAFAKCQKQLKILQDELGEKIMENNGWEEKQKELAKSRREWNENYMANSFELAKETVIGVSTVAGVSAGLLFGGGVGDCIMQDIQKLSGVKRLNRFLRNSVLVGGGVFLLVGMIGRRMANSMLKEDGYKLGLPKEKVPTL